MATPAASVVAGDELVRLHEEYSGQLYRFCLGRLRSREEAEDAVQNTFLRAYSALARGVTPRSDAAWLYTIAQRVCISRGEASRRRANVEALRDPDELASGGPAPEDTHELAGLAEALAEMPANLRQAILLREWRGLSYREVAAEMGLSQSAVETLIFRARRHLAAALGRVVERPARSLAGLLNLTWVFRILRMFNRSGRGPVVVSAKTAATVGALLAAGVGLGVGLTLSSFSRPALRAGSSAGTTAAAVQSEQGAAVGAHRAARRSRVPPRTAPGSSRPGSDAAPAGQVRAGTQPASSSSGRSRPAAITGTPQAQTPLAATQAARAVHELQAAVTSVLSAVAGDLPGLPGAPTVPTVTTPTVPATSLPSATTPTVPGASVPSATTPTAPSVPSPVTPTTPQLSVTTPTLPSN